MSKDISALRDAKITGTIDGETDPVSGLVHDPRWAWPNIAARDPDIPKALGIELSEFFSSQLIE
jgi:hypothetical protein